jgi:RNA polymerase sigma-70 factor (ECF subfamily)
VAYRAALKANALAARRRARERPVVDLPAADASDDVMWRDLRPVLDEELNRLPEKYRAALVLCDLEGQTHEETARQLGCPRETVSTRVARARERLRLRFLRRGITLSVTALAAILARRAAAEVPPALLDSTVRAATRFAAGESAAAAVVSAPVATLTKGVLTSMFLSKLKTAALGLLALAILGTGLGGSIYLALAGGAAPAGPAHGPTFAAGKARTAGDADQKTDKEKLQGTWQFVSAEKADKKLPDQELQEMEMVFSGDTVTIPMKGEKKEVPFKLDPSKKPREIDLVLVEGKPHRGIYSLEGDTLKLCLSEDENDERPTAFETKTGTRIMLIELKKK